MNMLSMLGIDPDQIMKFASELQKGVADMEARLKAIEDKLTVIQNDIEEFKK